MKKVIQSPFLTIALVIVLACVFISISKADDIPSPHEGAGCKDNTRINCGD